jgi:hypothetical protein
MTFTKKTVIFASITGAGLAASALAAIKFYPDMTGLLTAVGTVIAAAIAYITTKEKKDVN